MRPNGRSVGLARRHAMAIGAPIDSPPAPDQSTCMTPEQLAALRREYSTRGLRRAELDPAPIRQFEHWLAEAHLRGLPEPNAMTLATVDPGGQPWTRTVLLKAVDARGFTF